MNVSASDGIAVGVGVAQILTTILVTVWAARRGDSLKGSERRGEKSKSDWVRRVLSSAWLYGTLTVFWLYLLIILYRSDTPITKSFILMTVVAVGFIIWNLVVILVTELLNMVRRAISVAENILNHFLKIRDSLALTPPANTRKAKRRPKSR